MKHLTALAILAIGVGVLSVHHAPTPVAAQPSSTATDWPQWRGPNRDAVSRETGLLKTWPRTGPPVVWSAADLGAGFGSVSVRGDRVFVQGARRGQSLVFALNRTDGKVVWSRALGADGENDRGSG